MKALRTIFRAGAWLSVAIFVILSTGFLAFWTFPGLLINTANLNRARGYFPSSVQVSWKDIDLGAKSLSFFRKQIRLQGHDVCWRYSGQGIENCFASADLVAEIDIKGWFPKYRLGPVTLQGGTLHMAPPEQKEEPTAEQKKSTGLIPKPPEFLKNVALDAVRIELKKVTFITKAMRAEGKAELAAVGEARGSRWDLVAEASLVSGKDTYQADADIHLQSAQSHWFGPYLGTGDIEAKLPGGKTAHVDFSGKPLNENEISYGLNALYREKKRNFDLRLDGKGGTLGVSGKISGAATGIVKNISKITLQDCPFSYLKEKEESDLAKAAIDCAIQIGTAFPNQTRTVYNTYLRTLSLRFKADAELPVGESTKEAKGQLALVMDPLLEKVKHGQGSLVTDFHGRLDDFPNNLDVNTRLLLDVPSFQRVVKMLDGFPWAIPDPFHTLDGEIRFEVTSKGRLGNGEIPLPIQFITRLKGPKQSLVLDGNGELKITDLGKNTKAHLGFKLQLSDVKLVLPQLSMSAPPRFIPDPRIKVPSQEPAPKREPAKDDKSFAYDLQIVTADKPVRLVSNLAKSEVPLTVDLRMTNEEAMNGSVRIANFNVEMFRREATVQHFHLRLTPDPDNMEVNAEVRVVYTDYTVKILLLGRAKAPEIKFVSEPPLPEKDVIAVLLFGKKIQALDSDQAQSVGSTRTAVADSAVSLASMYLLASTPVESVGYDPGTGVFNAKVRLADGTSLNVGSDFKGANQVGLRRRLASDLYLNTTYQDLGQMAQGAKQRLQTLLEWSKGY